MALQLQAISTPLQAGTRITTFSSPKSPQIVRIRAESRDNLDNLQRLNNNQQQQTRRTPEVTSTGMWSRFPTAKTVAQMMDTMERVMEDPYPFAYAPPASEGVRNGYGRGRTPWAIKEGEKEYKMRFDMPGMTKNDVKVWVEEKMLVVKAEKDKLSNGNAAEEGVWDAKGYGKYGFRIALPENIEFEKIQAEVKDGVLYINVPKASISSKILDINVQ